jgi:hypothetical protein
LVILALWRLALRLHSTVNRRSHSIANERRHHPKPLPFYLSVDAPGQLLAMLGSREHGKKR